MKPERVNDTYLLNFKCQGHTLALFDVDTGRVIDGSLPEQEAIEAPSHSAPSNIFAAFWAASGGSKVAFAKPLAIAVRQNISHQIMEKNAIHDISSAIQHPQAIALTAGTILGVGSGFYFGYQLGYTMAVTRIPKCNDSMFVRLAHSAEVWKIVQKSLVKNILLNIMDNASIMANPDNAKLTRSLLLDFENDKNTSNILRSVNTMDQNAMDQNIPDVGWSFGLFSCLLLPIALLTVALFAVIYGTVGVVNRG